MKENPLRYLRMKNGEKFNPDIVKNWYVARDFVLDKLNGEKSVISPSDNIHLHVVVMVNEDSLKPLMLAVVRQLALAAHFSNFEEVDKFGNLSCKNRTVITIVYPYQTKDIVSELSEEKYLCNLLDYCKYSVYGMPYNNDSYIDLELNIVQDVPRDYTYLWGEEDVKPYAKEQYKNVMDVEELIDTRKAVYASGMYKLGELIDNLPAEDIHCAKRYTLALNAFQYIQMGRMEGKPLVDTVKWDEKDNRLKVKEGISNLFCADSFELRRIGMEKWWNNEQKKKIEERNPFINMKDQMWEYFNEKLSISEHARWVVEKLIMGYRPLNDDEKNKYETMFGNQRKEYLKSLKSRSHDPAHIDLCSYSDLRRVDPDNRKYDSFLMLAIPKILDKVVEHDR